MTVIEYEARFHELSRHATINLPIKEEMVYCFVRDLSFQLWTENESMVSVGFSFLDIVDHAHTMEHLRCKPQGGSDKWAQHQGCYSG